MCAMASISRMPGLHERFVRARRSSPVGHWLRRTAGAPTAGVLARALLFVVEVLRLARAREELLQRVVGGLHPRLHLLLHLARAENRCRGRWA